MLSFFLAATLLTALACLAVLMPVLRRRPAPAVGVRDIDVYRMQLAEIDADLARGAIGAEEAAEARAELGRRILRASGQPGEAPASPAVTRWAMLAAVAAIPLVSWGIYAQIGSPELGDRPLAARLEGDPAQSSVEELVARAERHLEANPQDGEGWSVIAPVYLRMGRLHDAAAAYRRAIALAGEDAARLSGLAEALLAASEEPVEEADTALSRALALAPGDARARFLMGLVHARKGETAAARDLWQDLAASDIRPWSEFARRALGETAGPDMAAIENMVASLAARLEDNPADAEGWTRLVRSYVVLGRTEEARAALQRGLAALAASPDDAQRLRRFGAEQGLKEEGQ